MSPFTPKGSNYQLYAIRCSACGCIVGTQPFQDIATLIGNLEKTLNAIAVRLGVKPD
jgi:hypothetical protein